MKPTRLARLRIRLRTRMGTRIVAPLLLASLAVTVSAPPAAAADAEFTWEDLGRYVRATYFDGRNLVCAEMNGSPGDTAYVTVLAHVNNGWVFAATAVDPNRGDRTCARVPQQYEMGTGSFRLTWQSKNGYQRTYDMRQVYNFWL